MLLAALATAAAAQHPATYEGADREARLVAGAKKEGELVMYTSGQADDFNVLAKAFEQKYGVKMTMWRAGSEKVLQRAVTEARGGRLPVLRGVTKQLQILVLQRDGVGQSVK